MREIRSLENINILELVDTFNLSFSDYYVPFKLTQEQLEEKMNSENIELKYSVGVFDDNILIAFILNFTQIKNNKIIIYNGGTGVIPTKRGDSLTKKMYDYLLPILSNENVDYLILEVLENNIQAIKSYEKVGFKEFRKLNCFKGNITTSFQNDEIEIRKLNNRNWNVLSSFWDFEPSWQNSAKVMDNLSSSNISIGAYLNQELVGYLIYNPNLKRVNSFAVAKKYRNKSIANRMFNHIAKNYSETISVINIEHNSNATVNFLEKIGLENYVNQMEMKLILNKNNN